eukprot:5374373-Alexandrium_andersonii.AAC.1
MSASLVGSEMCIRDRPWPSCAGQTPSCCQCSAGGHEADEDAAGRDPGAVSYTHLTLPTICSV